MSGALSINARKLDLCTLLGATLFLSIGCIIAHKVAGEFNTSIILLLIACITTAIALTCEGFRSCSISFHDSTIANLVRYACIGASIVACIISIVLSSDESVREIPLILITISATITLHHFLKQCWNTYQLSRAG